MRTLEWDPSGNSLRLIDQRLLPDRLEMVSISDPAGVGAAIQNMTVRGAPAIGVTAAYGMALAALRSPAKTREALLADLEQAAIHLKASRPTAVNLAWAVDAMLSQAIRIDGQPAQISAQLLEYAHQMADEDVAINRRMALNGAILIQDGDTIIHHCNTGALATVDWGTALGAIRMAHEQGKRVHVLVDETRPRLQGARLTAWELDQYGIPYEIISDNMSGYFMHAGQVQKVMFGADRVAANGDVANKIGTYMLALAAADNGVPAYSVFPTSTVDLSLASGETIPIEERSQDEVLDIQIAGQRVTPKGAKARNPAFDITPHRLLSGLVTEAGVVYPPFDVNLPENVRSAQTHSHGK
ncbi:MAG TPA: S-methyl-5-thioribose-1-phosphate isomerase [Anaerolineaceae bacterium]|jgi:methylthioribose-1-phosphate isomerase